jgi:hypothetical protein
MYIYIYIFIHRHTERSKIVSLTLSEGLWDMEERKKMLENEKY